MALIYTGEDAMAEKRCECHDKGCPAHQGADECNSTSRITLYRIDMEDHTGTPMCDYCADDAFESGVFAAKD